MKNQMVMLVKLFSNMHEQSCSSHLCNFENFNRVMEEIEKLAVEVRQIERQHNYDPSVGALSRLSFSPSSVDSAPPGPPKPDYDDDDGKHEN